MSVIVSSLWGTVIQRFIPSILEYPREVVSALDSCPKIIRREQVQEH